MKIILAAGSIVFFVVVGISALIAAESPGESKNPAAGATDRPAKSASQPAAPSPAPEDIIRTVQDYIAGTSKAGAYWIRDPEDGTVRKLELVGYHGQVRKAGERFVVSVDFKDKETGAAVLVDIHVSPYLEILNDYIQKVDKKTRFTYDAQGNQVPAKAKIPRAK